MRLSIILIVAMLGNSLIFSQIDSIKKREPDNPTIITKFEPTRNPFTDLDSAIALTQKTNKKILLDVGGEWCIWCHKLDDFFEANKDITEFMKTHFVVLKVNYSKENKNEKFLSKYPKIPGYPHFFILDSKGKFLHSQDTAALEKDGGHDRDKLLSFLKEWASK